MNPCHTKLLGVIAMVREMSLNILNFRAVKMHHAHRALADTDGANQNEQNAKSYAFQNHL